MYCDLSLDLPEKYIVLSNRYNLEHGDHPLCFFDIECLYNMFNLITIYQTRLFFAELLLDDWIHVGASLRNSLIILVDFEKII